MKISNNASFLLNASKIQKLNKNNNINFSSRYDDDYDFPAFGELTDEWLRNLEINESSNKYYPDEIALAKKLIDTENSYTRKQLIYNDRYAALKEEKAINAGRAVLAIFTVGTSELIRARDVINCNSKAKKWVDKIELIRTDLINARAREIAADAANSDKLTELKAKYAETNAYIKEDVIRSEFLDLIQAKKEGFQVDIPNCLMFINQDESINEQFINWTIKETNVNSATIDIRNDDLLDALNEAEEKYQSTGKWNLIYVKNMQNAINPNLSKRTIIESMKAIMTSSAEYFHTTIIFSTDNPNNLNEVATESNRVKKIDISSAFDIEKEHKKLILDRLQDEKYLKKSPLSAINDMLFLSCGDRYKLNFDSSKNNINNAKKHIIKHFPSELPIEFSSILDKAIDNVWYINN